MRAREKWATRASADEFASTGAGQGLDLVTRPRAGPGSRGKHTRTGGRHVACVHVNARPGSGVCARAAPRPAAKCWQHWYIYPGRATSHSAGILNCWHSILQFRLIFISVSLSIFRIFLIFAMFFLNSHKISRQFIKLYPIFFKIFRFSNLFSQNWRFFARFIFGFLLKIVVYKAS